ncbi:MAG TPA: response regulator transcription factor [Ktedonobacterales bacterium]|nr:response regulator transcription factor [Ktedonobacterales bacterium]
MLEKSLDCLRVLIIDDHVLLREALCAILSKEADFEVVGWTSPEMAQARAKALRPDVILFAIASETTDWPGLAKQLLGCCPASRITIFTSVDDENLLLDAIQAGVHGYLHKTVSVPDVLAALRSISQGGQAIMGRHAAKLELKCSRHAAHDQPAARAALNTKEVEILRLAAQGNSNKEIGISLYWSEITIKRKMQEIYQKLQARDRAHAVAEALRLGLI